MEEHKRRSDRPAGAWLTSRLHDVRWVATALAILVAVVGSLLSVPLLLVSSSGPSEVFLQPAGELGPNPFTPSSTPPESSPPATPSEPPSTPRPSSSPQVAVGPVNIALDLGQKGGAPTWITALGTAMTPAVAVATFLLGKRKGEAAAEMPPAGKSTG
ncbi:hypothetical protein ACFW1M_04585 [Streptomyces inhibens]|uniref:hypothetical protein n=1 Tax=Streptomyces inhibens TaxID=2293571 RepID=UPI0036C9B0A7